MNNMKWRVILSPSVFRQTIVLGEYKTKWRAWLAAWSAVKRNPFAAAAIQRRKST